MANDILVNESSAAQYQTTLKDQTGTVIPASAISGLTLTLYDALTGTVVNSRSAQDVKNTNGGTLHATSGLFTMTFAAADNPIVTATEAEEHHVAVFEATVSGGGGGLKWVVDLWVRNLALAPVASPDLVTYALLTLPEARDALSLTKADENPRLARLINAVTDDLEARTGRRLRTRTYTSETRRVRDSDISPDGLAWHALEWPITALTSVTVDDTVQTRWVPGDAGDPEDFDVYVLEGAGAVHGWDRLYRTAGWSPGTRVVLTYTAGYGATGFPIPAVLKELALAMLRERFYAETRMSDMVASRSAQGESVTYPIQPGLTPRDFQTLAAFRRWAA